MNNAPFLVKILPIVLVPALMLVILIVLGIAHVQQQETLQAVQDEESREKMAAQEKFAELEREAPKLSLNYVTYLGPGMVGGWEDLELLGGHLQIRSAICKRIQTGRIAYLFPNLMNNEKNAAILAVSYLSQDIKAFDENSFSLSAALVRQFTQNLSLMVEGIYQWMKTTDSPFNSTFDIMRSRLRLRWDNLDNCREPTRGLSLQVDLIPSYQFMNSTFAYCITSLTGRLYQSVTSSKKNIFSLKVMFGSILARNGQPLPPPDLFYAGSETTLRGYTYWTVGADTIAGQPIGGLSMVIFSLELANRIGKNFGLTLFYDAGNVYAKSIPNFSQEGLLQSVGVGIWYDSPLGPLQLKAALPADKRPIDKTLQVYFKMGQSF